jgi:hypothetical protein
VRRGFAFAPLLTLSALACGSRTGLGVSAAHDAGTTLDASTLDASTLCETPAPAACSGWHPVGSATLVTAPMGQGGEVTSVVVDGCRAVVAWSTLSGTNASTVSWSTRAIAFDGSPLGPIEPHPELTTTGGGQGAMSLAKSTTGIAAIVSDSFGCRFVPLDDNAAEHGAITSQGSAACGSLSGDGAGFSFLIPSTQGGTPVALRRVDALGHTTATITLAVPNGRAVWDRKTLGDGSFLVDTFREDPTTAIYTDWLQSFDANGAARSKEVVVPGANTAPVLVAPTSNGALAAWSWSAIHVVPVDAHGSPIGADQPIPRAAPLYGMDVTPSPDGDVMLSWIEDVANAFDLYVVKLGPDGVKRSDPLKVMTIPQSRIFGAALGDRALLFYSDHGIRALPLACDR